MVRVSPPVLGVVAPRSPRPGAGMRRLPRAGGGHGARARRCTAPWPLSMNRQQTVNRPPRTARRGTKMASKWDRHPGNRGVCPRKVAGRNWTGATTGLRAHRDPLTKPHVCTPSCTPRECKPCTPLVHKRRHAAEPGQGLIFFSSGSSSRWATSMSYAACARSQ